MFMAAFSENIWYEPHIRMCESPHNYLVGVGDGYSSADYNEENVEVGDVYQNRGKKSPMLANLIERNNYIAKISHGPPDLRLMEDMWQSCYNMTGNNLNLDVYDLFWQTESYQGGWSAEDGNRADHISVSLTTQNWPRDESEGFDTEIKFWETKGVLE